MEKGLDLLAESAKEFIQTVITPPLAEIGGLFADKVRIYRLKNQINIVTKAEELLKKNNIKSKKINLKLVAPLLEDCSLEDDEDLQSMWANLLANTVREDSDITTTIFIHILSQLSKEEAFLFESLAMRSSLENNGNTERHKVLNDIDRIENHKKSMMMLDNLYRLRLIKDVSGLVVATNNRIQVTQLGYNFLEACTHK